MTRKAKPTASNPATPKDKTKGAGKAARSTAPKKPVKVARDAVKAETGLTPKQASFVAEYLIDLNATQAAIRAGYSVKTAQEIGAENLSKPIIASAITKAREQRSERTEITQDRVLREAWGIATADVNDLVEFRRGCCRHCYGIDGGYQRTVPEMSRDRALYERDRMKAARKPDFDPLMHDDFDEKGGIGFDAKLPPNPDCQTCWGEGEGRAFFKDTRNLSPEARALYAGVKITKDGHQMLLIDKTAAMEKLFKHFGLYDKDNKQKSDGLADLVAAIHARNTKLQIKGQG